MASIHHAGTWRIHRAGGVFLFAHRAHHSLINKWPHFLHDGVEPLHLLLLGVAQPRGQVAHQVRQALEPKAAPELQSAHDR